MGANHSQDLNYCYTMPNSREPGFTSVYRNSKFANQLSSSTDPSVRTYRDVILQSCLQKFSNNNLAGKIVITKPSKDGKQPEERQIHSLTYKQCFEQAELLGKAILGRKLQYKQKTQGFRIAGIYAKNRVEWLITDFACSLFGITTIPLYDTLGLENLTYVFNQTEMTTVFLSDATLKVLLGLKDHGSLKNLVLFDRVDKQTVQKANQLGFNVIDFASLVEQGKNFPSISYKDIKIQPNDIYTFSYTSGTTGPPKGAMLTNRNITSFLSGFANSGIKFQENDVYLSFLPLPHVFERVCVAAHVLVGSQVVFYGGDMLKIKDDCKLVRPTIFVAVPRIFNKIVQKVEDGFNQKTGITKCLVESAVKTKLQNIQKNGDFSHGCYDKIVFSKVKQAFGGRVRLMISGSAPLSKRNFMFMEMLMSAPIYEGYGQTQNTAAAFVRWQQDNVLGHVGGVVTGLQFKLADIPEMKYTSDDKDANGKSTPRGQIWLRGPAVFAGYYKLKDKTEEAMTKDGWLRTGDVGVLLEGGRMKVIDRKKNIFKLQQGQYVAPQKVQDIYLKSHYVQEVFLYGESTQNFCVAIVKPKSQHFIELAKKNNISGSYEQLCSDKKMRLILIKQLFSAGKSSNLNTFEQAKNIYLQSSSFADKHILTNTMKLQRFEAKSVYKQTIQDLYNEGQLPIK